MTVTCAFKGYLIPKPGTGFLEAILEIPMVEAHLSYQINCYQTLEWGEPETRINLKGRTGPLLGWC